MSASWPIVFMGTPQIAAETLDHLLSSPDSVVGVVTQPDRPSGRGQKTPPSPVRKARRSHGIPVLAAEKLGRPNSLKLCGLGGPHHRRRSLRTHSAENNSRNCTAWLCQRPLFAAAEIPRRGAGGMDYYQRRTGRRRNNHEAG